MVRAPNNHKVWRRVSGRILLAVALLVFAVSASAVSVRSLHADDPPPQDVTLIDLQIRDVVARGIIATVEIFFPGPDGWVLEPSGHFLQLTFSHSPLLRPDLSTMTVLLNDSSLTPVRLDEINIESTTITVDLPARLLDPLFNRIGLSFLMRLTDFCDDAENPALWTLIESSTLLHYEYVPDDTRPIFVPNLANFPEPYLRLPFPFKTDTHVLLPANPNGAELSASASIVGGLGQIVGPGAAFFVPVRFDIGVPSSAATADASIISVGTTGRNPLVVSGDVSSTGATVTGPSVGFLQETVSPFSDKHGALIVSGDGAVGLSRAAQAVSGSQGMDTLAGEFAIVTDALGATVRGQPFDGGVQFAFADLQAPIGIQLRGISGSLATIQFLAPAPTGDGELELIVSLSRELDPEPSNLLIILNGVNLETIPLRFDGRFERISIPITIPAEAIRPGVNELTLATGLYILDQPEGPFNTCLDDLLAEERAWLEIHPESRIRVPGTDVIPLHDLTFYPWPFMDAFGDPSGTLVVVPSGMQPEELFGLVFDLGAYSGLDPFSLRVVPEDEATDALLAGHHVILVGRPSALGLINEAGASLPLQFVNGTDRILRTEVLLDRGIDPEAELGVLMVAPSPWNSEKSILVVTGTSRDGLFWGRRALGRLEASGPLTMVTARDKVETFPRTAAEITEALTADITDVDRDDDDDGGLDFDDKVIAAVVAALGVFGLALLGLHLWRVDRSSEELEHD